jgi:hypothetical protein
MMADLINPLSPMEMQIQQQSVDRQRKIAEYLQQQSLTPDQGQMVSGHYVAPSPTQYLAKLAQGLIGKQQQTDLDQKQMGLAKQYSNGLDSLARQLVYGDSSGAPPAATQPAAQPTPPTTSPAVTLNDGSGNPSVFKQPYTPTGSDSATPAGSSTTPQGGNPMFKNISPALVSNFLMNKDSPLGKIVEMQIQANLKGVEPTDLIKTMAASGIDPKSAQGQQILNSNITKANYIAPINAREGSTILDPRTNKPIFNAPNKEGFQYQFDSDGNATARPIPGAAKAIAENSTAKARGPATFKTQKVWDQKTGQYVYSTAADIADAAGGAPTTPNSIPPVGPQVQRQRDAQAIEMARQDIENASTPQDKQQAQRVHDTMVARYNAGQSVITGPANAPQSGAPVAEPAPGFSESQTVLAKEGAKRYNDLVSQAAESPVRVNVYDNILNLSRDGVATGPGEQWKNTVKGYAANTPFLGSVAPAKWKDDVSGFQELNKFLYQNAQRNWQAAGGTGTDAQLEAFTHSNPNEKMFPKALQMMAQWGKAGELALQAKANAMQRFKDANGGNIANQDQFERSWRNAFDPRVFQLNIMSPDEQKAFVVKLPPAEARALLEKRAALRQLGGL